MQGSGAQGVNTDPRAGESAADAQGTIDWLFPPLEAGHGIGREGEQTNGSGTVSGYGTEPTGEPPPSARDEVSVPNGPAARLSPGATAFTPRGGTMTSTAHGGSETSMMSASAVRLNPTAVAFVPRGGVSSVGGPMCPDDHMLCPDGTRAARPVRSNANRYTYHCNMCRTG